MKALFLVVCAALVSARPALAQQVSERQRAAIADTIKSLVNKLYEAENRRDADVFISEATDDPDFRYISTGNLFPSKDSLSRAAHARVKSLRA